MNISSTHRITCRGRSFPNLTVFLLLAIFGCGGRPKDEPVFHDPRMPNRLWVPEAEAGNTKALICSNLSGHQDILNKFQQITFIINFDKKMIYCPDISKHSDTKEFTNSRINFTCSSILSSFLSGTGYDALDARDDWEFTIDRFSGDVKIELTEVRGGKAAKYVKMRTENAKSQIRSFDMRTGSGDAASY